MERAYSFNILLRCIFTFLLMQASSLLKGQDYVGTWKGNGIQIDDNQCWSIHVTLTSTKGTATFPSLGCKASLDLIKKDGNAFIFSETFITGIDNCISGLNVKFTIIGDNKELMNLFEIDSKGKMISYATLLRQ